MREQNDFGSGWQEQSKETFVPDQFKCSHKRASAQQQICAIAVLLLILKGKLQRRIFKRWPQYSSMNKTEEIVKRYDRKRSIVNRLRYAVHTSILLSFYTSFRFGEGRPSIATFCFWCAFLLVLIGQAYNLSLYGFGTTREGQVAVIRGKKLAPFQWRRLAVSILIGILLIEAYAFATSDRNF